MMTFSSTSASVASTAASTTAFTNGAPGRKMMGLALREPKITRRAGYVVTERKLKPEELFPKELTFEVRI
jgi:hypothetical protein